MVEGAEDEFFLSLEEDEPAAKVVKSKPTPQKKKKPKKNALNFRMDDLPKQCLGVIHNN